jgi:hypothetical protein
VTIYEYDYRDDGDDGKTENTIRPTMGYQIERLKSKKNKNKKGWMKRQRWKTPNLLLLVVLHDSPLP